MLYLFLADGFEETEAIACLDVIRRAEIAVQTVSIDKPLVKGSHGISVKADISMDEITTEHLEGIILPGGMPGTLNLEKDERLSALIEYCCQNNLLITAICAAPSILGKRGLLKGEKAVCFPGFEDFLEGADVLKEKCVESGQFVTAKAMGAAIDFGIAIVARLKSPDLAEHIKRSICHG